MMTSFTISGLVPFAIFFTSFDGPYKNLGQPIIPAQQKIRALTDYARDGNSRECERILTYVPTMKTKARKDQDRYVEAQKELAKAIQDKRAFPGKLTAGDYRQMKAHQGTFDLCHEAELRLRELIQWRGREERAFSQVYETIRALRSIGKKPSPKKAG